MCWKRIGFFMTYEIVLIVVFFVGLSLQSRAVFSSDGQGLLGFLGHDLDKTGRTLCFIGLLGMSVLLLGVEVFLVFFTLIACVVCYTYRFFFPKQLKKILAMDGFLSDVLSFCQEYATFLLVVFVIRNFCVQHYRVPTGSLEPTVRPGDFLLVNQFSYGWHYPMPIINTKFLDYGKPQRGDVALFRNPKDPYRMIYVKRVVGLPGDHVVYRNKQLSINGQPIKQEYVGLEQEFGSGNHEWLSKRIEFLPGKTHDIYVRSGLFNSSGDMNINLIVPEGSYYMMGDNRDLSFDSRFFGPVEEKYLLGKVIIILFSWDGWTPDWSRMGASL